MGLSMQRFYWWNHMWKKKKKKKGEEVKEKRKSQLFGLSSKVIPSVTPGGLSTILLLHTLKNPDSLNRQ
jgi:hypothetical protein